MNQRPTIAALILFLWFTAAAPPVLGNTTIHEFDEFGNVTRTIDALGGVTRRSYDANDNETSTTTPLGFTTRRDFDSKGNLLSEADPLGNVTSYTYDHDKRPLAIIDALNQATLLSYTTNGNLTSMVDPGGTESRFGYDGSGNLTRVSEPGSRITSYGYDVENRQTSTTDTLGNTTYTLYDALGRTTATILPDATMPTVVLTEVAAIAAASELADNPRTLTEYDADGRVIATTDALGNTTTYVYDAAGRRTGTLDALGNRFVSTYDASGRQTAMTDAKGSTTTYIYDVAGRLIRTNLPDGTHTESAYDALGRRVASTDAEGNTTQYAYDPQGRLIAVTDALGHTTRYGYDLRGLQTTQTDALGRTTRYEYDAMGRRTARILPEGQREEMTYNNLGLMTSHKDFNGYSTTRSYALATNFLTSIQAASNHPSTTLSHAPYRFEFSYDLLGRRTTSISRSKAGAILTQETYSYDAQSRLLSYSGPAGGIGYAYDANGNLAGAKSGTPGGYDVSYDYDALGRLSNVYRGQEGNDPNASGLAAYNYDANGNLNGVGYANGVQHAYQYNALNRLTGLTVARAAGQSSPAATLQGYGYSLDANGMRTRITEHSGRTIDHVFDKLQRLTKESITGGYIGDPNGTLSYSYDAVGNRTQRNTTGEITALLPDQTQSFTANDRLTSDGYDANGNTTTSQATVRPTQTAGVTDIYSFDNRLIRRTRADGMEIDLTYTPDGNRSLKHVKQGGLTLRQHRYLTDSNNPTGYTQVIEEHDPLAVAGETLRKVHLYGHDLIATEQRNSSNNQSSIFNTQFYSYDGLGSVRGISNESGDLTETYDYDAYGNLIGFAKYNATTGSLESHNLSDPLFSYASLGSEYLFTGEQWDADLGMYFLRARYLNTATGTFHTMDTHEGHNGEPLTLHKYLYAHGNPVMGVDPSGMSLLSQVAATIGTLMRNIKSFAISAAYRTKMLFGIARIFITRIGASIQRWLITEIGKNAVLKAVWTEISHLSAYERGLWILRNLKWYQWVNLRALFLQGRASLDIFAKGPTIGGWVGSGVVVGSLVYFRDEVIEYVKGIIHIAKNPSTLFE